MSATIRSAPPTPSHRAVPAVRYAVEGRPFVRVERLQRRKSIQFGLGATTGPVSDLWLFDEPLGSANVASIEPVAESNRSRITET